VARAKLRKDETHVTKQRVGFIGLGSMGSAMAPRLVGAGYEVAGFDLDRQAVESFAAAGGKAAGSVAEVGQSCPIVLMSLPTPQAMEAVAAGPGGLREARPKIVIDLSTSGPRMSQSVARRLGEAGILFADAPVSGGRAGALAGRLSLMVAARAETWERVEPLLANFGRTFHVGEAPGQGQMTKLVNNLLSVVALAVSCEGMALGAKAGLDPQRMLEVINASSGRNSATLVKIPRSVLSRSFDFGFSTALSSKDVALCLEEAEAIGVPMLMGSMARNLLAVTSARFGGECDFTNMARLFEEWAGVEIGGAKP
jgi:3-hydroxyisobutyrate dehydrogenase-like beta-hydroxyacid dehydrogenase